MTSAEQSPETQYKEKALKQWLKGRKNFDGGIVVQDGPNGWKLDGKKLTF